jgi:hypothetical protein
MNVYEPANKEGTLLQQAQYWLEKAASFELRKETKQAEMAFNMAMKKEREHHGLDKAIVCHQS